MAKALETGIIFLLGFLSCAVILYGFLFFQATNPLNSNDSIESPSDWINKNQIKVSQDKLILNIEGISLSSYNPTGSMLPVLSETANGIRIVPEMPEQIRIGDIISYQTEQGLIVHRVTARGYDNKGYYFITQGDNNELSDGKIRFSEIKYVTIGILY